MDEEKWLNENKKLYKISKLEEEVGCPKDTIQKFIQGKQAFPEKWKKKFKDFLLKHANSIINNLKIFCL